MNPGDVVCHTGAVQPLGVHHVSINVRDAAESIEFYTGMLGLTARSDRPDFAFGGAWLDIGGQQVHLIEGEVPNSCGQHFAIQVADLDAPSPNCAVAASKYATRAGSAPHARRSCSTRRAT